MIKKLKWRQIFSVALLVIVVILLYRYRGEIKYSANLARQIRPSYLFFILIAQTLTYLFDALIIEKLFKIFNQTEEVPFKKFFQVAIVAKFINNVLPSAGVSGSSFLINFFHQRSIRNGQAIIASLIFYLFYVFSFFLFLLFSLVYLFLRGGLGTSYLVAGWIAAIIFLILLILLFFLLRAGTHFFSFLGKIIIKINDFIARWHKKKELSSNLLDFFREMSLGKRLVNQDKKELIAPFVNSLLFNFFNYLTIYFVFLGIGYPLSIGKIICGASIAGLFSFVTFLPMGMGVYETTMAMSYYGFGVPLNLSVLATLIYRFFSLWLPLPVGMVMYHRLNKRK